MINDQSIINHQLVLLLLLLTMNENAASHALVLVIQ